MKFLETTSGLIAAHCIVRLCLTRTGREYDVDYSHGSQPCTARASCDAVEDFLEDSQ